MRKALIPIAVLVLTVLAVAQRRQPTAEEKAKRPSPPGTAEVVLNGKKITIDYSRPKMADPRTGQPRKIMGDLVPYGQEWRTGANEATSFVTETGLMIGSTHVPAGIYTLYTLPEADKWTLIISKKTGQWGIPYPGKADDLARIPMKVEKLKSAVDPFTISLEKKGDSAAILKLAWENTQASIEIMAH